MLIDCLIMMLGVKNDVDRHHNVRLIIIPANCINSIMPRRHEQSGVFHDLHLTTVYFRFSQISLSNGKHG